MNVLDSTSSKLFKKTKYSQISQTHWTSFNTGHSTCKLSVQDRWGALYPNYQSLNVATLQQIILNYFDLRSFMETWPNMAPIPPRISKYTPPTSKATRKWTIWHKSIYQDLFKRYMWSLIPAFVACLGVESHNFAKHLLKVQFFSQNFKPETHLTCPKLETEFLAHASRIEAPAVIVLGIHRGRFREQKLCSCDLAVARRQVERRDASGALPGPSAAVASGGRRRRGRCAAKTTKVMGSWALYTLSTDKRTMNVLDSTSSKLFKKTKYSQISQTHWTSFNTGYSTCKLSVQDRVRGIVSKLSES